MEIDQRKLGEFMNRVVSDVGAAMSGVLSLMGDELGIYKAMAKSGPVTPAELASLTRTNERYVREWLNAQAAGSYVSYDASSGRYTLPPEQAFALAEELSPVFSSGFFQVTKAMWQSEERIVQNFRDGRGTEWGEHHQCLFAGTERSFRAAYLGYLLSEWIPALENVELKLRNGAKAADVGCGHGASTILLAKAFPTSRFWGFDSHAPSIELARQRAREAGVEARVHFEVARATDYPGRAYDLVAHFDSLHDMEDPDAAARHARSSLADDGTWMVVEPRASDRPEENHNPIGRLFYSVSTMVCVPHSLSRRGPALGAQAGEARLREVIVTRGGFSRLRRAFETPFNLVLEARP